MNEKSPVGDVFGRFTVISKDTLTSSNGKWFCRCECGTVKSVYLSNLRRGLSKSCGCLRSELQSSKQLIDRKGHVYGRLTVLKQVGYIGDHAAWLCKCSCGTEIKIAAGGLASGDTQSCGCLHRERAATAKRTHGLTGTKEYRSWVAMKARCTNENRDNYDHYGGRGIVICDRWLNSFENFYSDMGPAPTDRHSVERNDRDGNYEPNNCRWATQSEQMRNTSRSKKVEWDGMTIPLIQLAEITNVDYDLLQSRLARGWSVEDAVSLPRHSKV